MYRTWTHLADSILDKRVHSIHFSGHSDSRKKYPMNSWQKVTNHDLEFFFFFFLGIHYMFFFFKVY